MAACVLILAGIGGWYILGDQKIKTPSLQTLSKIETKMAIPSTVLPKRLDTEKKEIRLIAKAHTPLKQKIGYMPIQSVNSTADLQVLTDMENSFNQIINLQRVKVSGTPMFAETAEYFNDFKIQIRQMEKDEKVIKSDISKNGMRDELLEQLINLYQQKLTVLKKLQVEMNKTNNRFKQNRGPVDSTKTYFLSI